MKGKGSGEPAFHLLRWDHLVTVKITVRLPVQQPAESLVNREGTSSILPAGSVLQAMAVPSAWFRPSCGQRACSHFSVSLTHWARHLTAMTKLNLGRDSQSPFSIAGALQTTAERWKLSRSFLLWRFWTSSDTANTLHSGSHLKKGWSV